MGRVPGGNEEQFQMLLMALEDMNGGICLFQSEEQSGWVARIREELKNRKVCVHNIGEDDEESGMPLISDFKKWAEAGADVVIVYNLQLLGLRFGDQKAVEHLNFMRDQLQYTGKLFLFGVSPYFGLLMSRNARDLYSCVRYHFKFASATLETGGGSLPEPPGLSGNYTLTIEKYWEYKKRARDRTGEERVRLCLECMDSWQQVRGNLPLQEMDEIRRMAECVDAYYRGKEFDLSEVGQIWILAFTWLELGEKEEGLYWYQRTADRIRDELGEDHKLYADALVKLSEYYQLTGQFEQCERNYDWALRFYIEKGMPIESYQYTLMKRAVLFARNRQFDQALAIYEKFVQYYTEKYGSGYLMNAYCLNNIGQIYGQLGNASGALEKYQKGLELLLASGQKNELLGALYNNIGALYLENGDLKNAWKNLRMAKREMENVYGRDSEHLAKIYNLMSEVWNRRGRVDKEKECLEKALKLIEKTHTEETEQAACVYFNMGDVLAREYNTWRAIPFYNKALELHLKIYGELNAKTASTYEGLGIAFCQLDHKEESRKNLGKAREIYTVLYGKDDARVKGLEQLMND